MGRTFWVERNANSMPIGVYDHELNGKAKVQDGWNGASANANQYLAAGAREADEVRLGHDVHSGFFLCSPKPLRSKFGAEQDIVRLAV